MKISLLITGDFCPHLNDLDDNSFEDIKDILSGHDLIITNLECALKYKDEKPIIKEGPSLYSNEEQLKYITCYGKTLFTIANNHTLDYGYEGFNNIIDYCKNNSVEFVGGGKNSEEASKPFYFEKDKCKIAIINCCEQEFSIAGDMTSGANPMEPIKIYNQIQQAKNKASIIIVIAHGGHEYYQLPSPRLQENYRFFIDAGANAVVGHHPHCISGMEEYKDGIIFYSLGNFYFNNKNRDRSVWNEGFCLNIKIDSVAQKISTYEKIPYVQCYNNNKILKLREPDLSIFNNKFDELSSIIVDDMRLNEKYCKYKKSQERKAISRILPYTNRYLVALYKRGYLPSLLSRKDLATRLNAVRCESHRELLISALNKKYLKK